MSVIIGSKKRYTVHLHNEKHIGFVTLCGAAFQLVKVLYSTLRRCVGKTNYALFFKGNTLYFKKNFVGQSFNVKIKA